MPILKAVTHANCSLRYLGFNAGNRCALHEDSKLAHTSSTVNGSFRGEFVKLCIFLDGRFVPTAANSTNCSSGPYSAASGVRAAWIRPRMFAAASGMLVPGPKIALTPLE